MSSVWNLKKLWMGSIWKGSIQKGVLSRQVLSRRGSIWVLCGIVYGVLESMIRHPLPRHPPQLNRISMIPLRQALIG